MYTADNTIRVSIVLLTTQASGSQDGGLDPTINPYNRPSNYEVQQLQVMAKRMTRWNVLRLSSADTPPCRHNYLYLDTSGADRDVICDSASMYDRYSYAVRKRGLNKLASDLRRYLHLLQPSEDVQLDPGSQLPIIQYTGT